MGRSRYTLEEDTLIKEYLLSHKTVDGLHIEGRTPKSIYVRVSRLRKKGFIPNIERPFDDPQNVEIVRSIISNNSDNLSRAFRLIAEKLNVSENTIKVYWYSRKKENNPISKHNIGACFASVGRRSIVNSKNVMGDTILTKSSIGLWRIVKKAISRIF